MNLEVREVVGGSTEIVDTDRDGGEGQPLIVARTYEPEITALLLAAPNLLAALRMAREELCMGGDWENARRIVDAAIANAEGR